MQVTYYELDFLDGTTKAFTTEDDAHDWAKERQIVAYAINTFYKETEQFDK